MTRIVRVILVGLLWIYLVSGSLAQCALAKPAGVTPALGEVEKAIERADHELALRLARALPAGPTRQLVIAEVASLLQRMDLARKAMDGVEFSAVPADLRGKYYLFRAYDESSSSNHRLRSDREQALERMVDEGLRSSPAPHDKAYLLFLRIGKSSLAKAREAGRQAVEDPMLDDLLVLRCQAMVAERDQDHALAARWWRTLARTFSGADDQRARTHFSLKALASQDRAVSKPENLATVLELLNQSLRRGDSSSTLEALWLALGKLPEIQQAELRATVSKELSKLPAGSEKLRLCWFLARFSEGQDAQKLADEGRRLAETMGEDLLALSFQTPSIRGFRGAAGQLIPTGFQQRWEELGGKLSSGSWFDSVPYLLSSSTGAAPVETSNLESLARELRDVDASDMEARGNIFQRHLFIGASNLDAPLLEKAFFQGLEEGAMLPAVDRLGRFRQLIGQLDTLEATKLLPVTGSSSDALHDALVRALGEKLASRPDLVDPVLDDLVSSADGDFFRLYWLAEILSFLGRDAEAEDLRMEARPASPNPHLSSSLDWLLGAARLTRGDASGVELLAQAEEIRQSKLGYPLTLTPAWRAWKGAGLPTPRRRPDKLWAVFRPWNRKKKSAELCAVAPTSCSLWRFTLKAGTKRQ